MSGLLLCPKQKSNEHLIGYLRRLAMLNGYLGWRDLVRAVGFKPTKAVLENNSDAVMRTLGVSKSEGSTSLTLQKHLTKAGFFDRPRYEPVCVHCLRESEHSRREWSHCLVVACPDHECQLVDRCPSCNEMLENTRSGIAICDCGFDLRFAKPPSATPMQCWSSARMAGDMQPIAPVEEIGTEDEYRFLAYLVFQLAVRFDPRSKINPGAAIRPKSIADAVALMEPILTIFEDLRPRLTSHIASRFSAGNQNAFNLSGRLGPWYKALDDVCRKNRAFPVIWEIFSDAVFDNFDGLIRGQSGLTPSLGKTRQYLGVMEAAKFVGVSKPVLQDAIAKKQIFVRTGRPGINYAVHMISREQCEAASRLRSNWISSSSACAFLCVPKSVLQHLVNAEIVTLDRKWEQSVFKAGPICRDQLRGLLDKMKDLIQVRPAKRTLRLDQIDARRTVDIKALVRLYRAIFSGELHAVGRDDDEGLGGLIFSAEEVTSYLGSAALDNALTLKQLALATGWKYDSIAGWAKHNLLESRLVVLQGRSSRVVTIEGLARFRREWIPISEIAAAVDSKGSAVSKHLVRKGIAISGLIHERNGAARGGLIRVSDLGLLAGLSVRDPSRIRIQSGGKDVD